MIDTKTQAQAIRKHADRIADLLTAENLSDAERLEFFRVRDRLQARLDQISEHFNFIIAQ